MIDKNVNGVNCFYTENTVAMSLCLILVIVDTIHNYVNIPYKRGYMIIGQWCQWQIKTPKHDIFGFIHVIDNYGFEFISVQDVNFWYPLQE